MRKETAWAIGIGIIFGLILAFGLWKINLSVKNPPTTKNVNIASPSPTVTQKPNVKIQIEIPKNGDVISNNTITISGIVTPNSKIVISGEEMDYLVNASESGKFQEEVDLISGINQISVTSFIDDKIDASNVLVVYSTTDAKPNSKSYIGTVTDITDTNIQIKTTKNEIKQIAINEETTTSAKKITDIGIGDFVAGIGIINSNSVLDASRVLVTKPIVEFNVKAKMGVYKKGEFTFDKKTVKPKDLKDGMDIIYTEVDDIVRTVFTLSS